MARGSKYLYALLVLRQHLYNLLIIIDFILQIIGVSNPQIADMRLKAVQTATVTVSGQHQLVLLPQVIAIQMNASHSQPAVAAIVAQCNPNGHALLNRHDPDMLDPTSLNTKRIIVQK